MFFERDLSKACRRYVKFPVVVIVGPRQSGKTTLARHHFNKHTYLNLENPELRSFALEDPNRFLREFENAHGVIIDEFQYAPQLLSYIQISADERKRPGYFVLTDSQNFVLNSAVSQSLAGRAGILTLLPLSLHELLSNKLIHDVDSAIFQGAYPRLYEGRIGAADLYPSYIQTYVERDVRLISNVGDLLAFQKFMRLCAARIGQLLNIADLAIALGMDQRQIKKWLSILEASYVIFLLKPHHQNFNKRLTKTPKLYFYDTGLACSLLDIKTVESLALSPYRGFLFESLIVSDFQKQYFNRGLSAPSTYFWRDQNGRVEVDCIIDRGDALFPVEIKSGETIAPSFFSSLSAWSELSKSPKERAVIIYGGKSRQTRSRGKVLGWMEASQLIPKLLLSVGKKPFRYAT